MDWTERQMVITKWAGDMEAVARNLRCGADDNHRKGLDYAIEAALDVWGEKGRIPDELRAALYGDDADEE
jgi:hypothetical protein